MVKILDQYGKPIQIARPTRVPGMGRAGALNSGWGRTAYDAADVYDPHMESWRPFTWSADVALNPFRDRIAARARDMERNDGWAKSGVQNIVDNTVGGSLRPISKPDYRALAQYSGNSKFDAQWARDFGQAVEACFRPWANDLGRYNDTLRMNTFGQQMFVQMRHTLIDNDAITIMNWRPDLIGPGRARYATSVQLIDPDRLSNPNMNWDTMHCRGGVQTDDYGAPIGYHIRRAHIADWFAGAKTMTWDYYERETSWGRPRVIHHFEPEYASQHRGGAGVLTSVMQRLKMLIKYDGTELDAAIINAIFAAYVKSPYDPQMVEEAMNAGPQGPDSFGAYQDFRNEYWEGRNVPIGDSRVTMLAPGEEIGTVTAARPAGNFEPFEAAILRHLAAGMGTTYEGLTGDYSRTNYSSFRGAANEVRKVFDRRFNFFIAGQASQIFGCFVEEIMDVEDMPLPAGEVPPFMEMRSAFSRCHWLGTAQGFVDEVKEKQGALLGMEGGISTLEIEAAKQGLDYRELIHQRNIELEEFGNRPPPWAAMPDLHTGDQISGKPVAPGGST